MKTKLTCAFVGHRRIEKTEALKRKLTDAVTALIDEEADTFGSEARVGLMNYAMIL